MPSPRLHVVMVRSTMRPGGPSIASLLLLSCLLGADRAIAQCTCPNGVPDTNNGICLGNSAPPIVPPGSFTWPPKIFCVSCNAGYSLKLPSANSSRPPYCNLNLSNPGGHDDPHFTTLKGERYEYHGQCDLIYTTCPSFDNNKGLRIHLRTKHVEPKNWSTITNLAVKIGEDTFELQNDGTYRINSEVNPALSDTTNLAGHGMRRVGFKRNGNTFSIALDNALSLDVTHFSKTLKTNEIRNSLAFKISGVHEHRDNGGTSLLDCVGLSSTWDHPEGDRFLVGRSGTTHPRTDASFGNEWQVDLTKDDPMLFAEDFGQQLPDQSCTDGLKDAGRRQLEGTPEGDAVIRQAEDACRHLKGGNTHTFEACVHDVIATGDVSFAEDPWYNGEF